MTEILEFLKIYKDYGVGGLFLALELFTVYFFYKELKSSKNEMIEMTVKVTTIADKAANAIEESSRLCLDVKSGMDQTRSQNNEFMAFLRGRDEHRRTGR